MDKLARNYRSKKGVYVGFGADSPALLIIRLPDSRALRIMSRSLFLTMFLLALPSLCSMMQASADAHPSELDKGSDATNGFNNLPVLLHDLLDEGLIKKGHTGLIFGTGIRSIGAEDDLRFLRDAGIDLLTGSDLQTKEVAAHKVFDFVMTTSFYMVRQIDGNVKDNGLVVSQLGVDPSDGLRLLDSYKIVYLRRLDSTVVAMRKTRASDVKEVFHGITPEKKKAALKGLEDVYLEPPTRAALGKRSSFTSRKIKFLPDLLKDSLDEYPRRIFVSDDVAAREWFYKNYPTKDQEFDVFRMDDAAAGQQETGVSNWLKNKVRPEDYVVMKAEAQVVEQMLKDRTLYLVDELFLECNNQWQDGNGDEESMGKWAYWQCLALYGKVRDEGIAVHQWWNGL